MIKRTALIVSILATVLLVIVLGLLGPIAAAETPADPAVTAAVAPLDSIKDNTLYGESDSLSNGSGAYFMAGVNGNGDPRRGLLKFDIANNVPLNSLIISATLRLYVSKNPFLPHQAEAFALHRVLSEWGEGASDAPGEEGGGGTAAIGDATWSFSYFSPTPTERISWSSPGGDFLPAASAKTLIGDAGHFYSWRHTPGMLADLMYWLRNPDDNHGWIILGNETDVYTARRFDSRENNEPANWPVLMVEYVQGYPSYLPLIIGQ